MPRNIEVKVRIASAEALLPLARALADGDPEVIDQDDCFYRVASGRLKLRRLAGGAAELIHYRRLDDTGARASDYLRVPVPDAAALHGALARGCGELGRVRKRRLLLLAGRTRIHLDRVEGLGDFLELEVMLCDGEADEEGRAAAGALLERLGLAKAETLAGSYLDLLACG
jgi:predicted adenylyl cyclase CyaB